MLSIDKKLWRELWGMRLQALAIAMVIVSGICIFIMSLSTLDSLFETRRSYYSEQHFAEVFASLKRAPVSMAKRIEELPGVDKKNVEVSVEGKELVITAERSEKVESDGLLRREIRSEKYKRSFTMGDTIDADSIKAKLENGILKVSMSRKPESVGRKVDVS